MNERIFKKGDRVYHFVFGWGEIIKHDTRDIYSVCFDGESMAQRECRLSFTEYDLINGGLSHERPFKLEVGKSYMAESGNAIVINRSGDYGNYGFYIGHWGDKIPCYTPGIWREATDEEVRNALLEEAIRRYGENWGDVKIVKSIGLMPDGDNEGRFDSRIFEDNEQGGWVVWNKNGRLFHKGVWAEKLEDPEFEPFQKVLVRDGQTCLWGADLFSNMTKSSDFPYKCVGSCWSQCIPYEGNEHLLGTTKSPGE